MIHIFRRSKFDPRALIPVAEGVSLVARMVGIPENLEKYGHNFSNREVGELAALARRWGGRMSLGYMETLMTAQQDGASLSNSAAATSVVPGQGKLTFNPSFFQRIGQAIRVLAMFRISNIVTTPGTWTPDIRLGATVAWNGGAGQLSTTAHTTLPLWLEVLMTVRAVGATGNFMSQGRASSQTLSLTAVADSATTCATLLFPNTAPAVGSNVDLTASQQFDLFNTFSIANAGNLAQLHQLIIESLN